MGCDINLYAEQRQGDCWHLAEPLVFEEWEEPPVHPREVFLSNSRNHELYTLLVGLFNHRYDDRVEVIAGPRSLPADLSPELRSWLQAFGDDPRYHSWILLSELLQFDWYGKTIDVAAWGVRLGRPISYAAFVGEEFMREVIERFGQGCSAPESVRFVFWFTF